MYPVPQRFPTVLGLGLILSADDDYEPGARSATWAIGDGRCDRTYMNRIKVQTASPSIGPLAIVSGLGIRIGDSYRFPLFEGGASETDTGSFLQSIKADLATEDGRQWLVTLDYAPYDVLSLLGGSDIGRGVVDPTEAALQVFWAEPAKYRRTKPYDESGEQEDGEPGQPFLNTAGDPLVDPPETEETRPVLCVIRNESTYNDFWASQYKDCVNSDEFLGFAPNTVKVKDIKGERKWEPDWGWYFTVTYLFEFRDDDDGQGFTLLIASLGYRQLVNGSGDPVNVTDDNGQQVTDAVPLQQDGSYDPGEPPYFMPFQEFPAVAFADLNIPDDILYVASGNT